METNNVLIENKWQISGPLFHGGTGSFLVHPIDAEILFWSINPTESKNNKYPYYLDEDVEKAKQNAELIVTAVNSCKQICPENPLKVAELLPEIIESLKDMAFIARLYADETTLSAEYKTKLKKANDLIKNINT